MSYQLTESNEEEIRSLLLYRKVVKVSDDTLALDNGTVLKFEGNWGCGGCASGEYDVTELNSCDNMITNVELVRTDENGGPVDDWEEGTTVYRIFVYAENRKINLLTVEGTDGNGWYGTGYHIDVYPVTAP